VSLEIFLSNTTTNKEREKKKNQKRTKNKKQNTKQGQINEQWLLNASTMLPSIIVAIDGK
jgi:hypothetical protein